MSAPTTPASTTIRSLGTVRPLAQRLFIGVGALPVVIIILAVIFWYFQPRFLSQTNLINVARQASFLAIVACAQMFPILSGGFDLSVGSIFALVSVIMAQLTKDVGMTWGITVALFSAGLVGLFNGVVISAFRVSPFVVTLGTLSAVRGVALMLANGQPVFGLPKHFSFLGAGYVGPIPIPIIIGAGVFLLGYILLRWTRFGRYMYAIGGNEEAARISGIQIKRYTTLAYVVCSLLAGVSGVILSSRVRSGQPTLGDGMELDSIAAVVIGGVALGGGSGTLPGVLFGTLILSVIQNGLNLMNVSTFTQYVVIGMIITLAVVFDRFRHPEQH